MARFRTFSPKPATLPCAIERPPKPPQPSHTPQPTTFFHHFLLPFPTALPKPSPSGSLSDLWAETRHPRLREQTQHPAAAAATSYAPLYHLPISPPVPIYIGAPETEPQRLSLGFCLQTPAPAWTIERSTKPPQQPHLPQPTTSTHYPLLPFPTAIPKPSPSGLVSDFGPETHCPRLRERTQHTRYPVAADTTF
jgi:hypothetical protein